MLLRASLEESSQDWELVLPSCLFAMRTARNRNLGMTPHFALFGREARAPVDLIYGKPEPEKYGANEYVNDLRDRMTQSFNRIRQNLETANDRERQQYRNKLQGTPLQENDLVWLFTPKVRPGESKKLTTMWTGPWRIKSKVAELLFSIQTEGDWNKNLVTTVVSIDRLRRYIPGDLQPKEGETEPLDLTAEDVTVNDEFVEHGVSDLPCGPRAKVRVTHSIPQEQIFDLQQQIENQRNAEIQDRQNAVAENPRNAENDGRVQTNRRVHFEDEDENVWPDASQRDEIEEDLIRDATRREATRREGEEEEAHDVTRRVEIRRSSSEEDETRMQEEEEADAPSAFRFDQSEEDDREMVQDPSEVPLPLSPTVPSRGVKRKEPPIPDITPPRRSTRLKALQDGALAPLFNEPEYYERKGSRKKTQ